MIVRKTVSPVKICNAANRSLFVFSIAFLIDANLIDKNRLARMIYTDYYETRIFTDTLFL